MSPSQTGGYQDDAEEEREALWHDIPEELPQGALDPWEGWPEGTCGPEYWLNRRALERGEL